MSFVDPKAYEKKEKKETATPPQTNSEYTLFQLLERIAVAVEAQTKVLEKIAGAQPEYVKVNPADKPMAAPKVDPPRPATSAPKPEPEVKSNPVDETKAKFDPQLADLLTFTAGTNCVLIAPKKYLGSGNFGKIAGKVREIGGKYVSAGKNSHFEVPI